MPDEDFDKNVASKMPNTRSGRPRRPWQMPLLAEGEAESEPGAANADLSMDKSSIDNQTIEIVDIDNLSMDGTSIETTSIDKPTTPKARYSHKLASLFDHFLPGLDPAQQTVLAWLVWLSDEQGLSPPVSYRDLSQRCGMSSKTAARTIKELVHKGRIQIHKSAFSREATVYAVQNWPPMQTGE